MKVWASYIIGGFIAISLAVVLLLTAVDIAAFKDLSFYKEQYRKNNVYEYVGISESQLMLVTEQLLGYMKGQEQGLDIKVEIDGNTTEFFNKKEKAHMIDVKNLVLTGIDIRRLLSVLIFVAILLLWRLKSDTRKVLSFSVIAGFPIIACGACVLGFIISKDFNSAFIKFHQLLFSNDLWILDYETDRLINIVPEEFFSAITLKIGVTFVLMFICAYIVALTLAFRKEKRNSGCSHSI